MNANFESLVPLISRRINSSKTETINSVPQILNLFSKIFYILIAETMNINLYYLEILTSDFLNEYDIKSSEIPFLNKTEHRYLTIKKKKSNTEKRSVLLGLFHLLNNNEENTEKKISFFTEIINRSFSKICGKDGFNISLKSDLKKGLNLNYFRFFEIKIFLEFILAEIHHDLKSEQNQKQLLRYGGYPGKFFEYLHQNLRVIMKKNQIIKRNTLPKNRSGTFFTPDWITTFVNLTALQYWYKYKADEKEEIPQKFPTIADISAGMGFFTGKFIDPEFKNKIHQMVEKIKNIKTTDYMGNNIYGYDSSEFLIDILRLNNTILEKINGQAINPSNIILKDTLMEKTGRKFDIIVGNPPWGVVIDKNKIKKIPELKKFQKKQFDSYSLFVARNILSLKEGGVLFLVLPETILLNPNYFSIREFILKNTSLLEIIHLGENIFDGVNMPSIILGLQNLHHSGGHKIKIVYNFSDEIKNSLKNNEIDLFDLIARTKTQSWLKNPIMMPIQGQFIKFKRLQKGFIENLGMTLDIFSSDVDREKLK
ncbi:MAG: HsdM family class I SAM-dependent methyltransferase, partial [Promethearchaeota archaeon]